MKKKISGYSKLELEKLLNDSSSYKDFLNKIGYVSSGNAYRHTKRYLTELGLNSNISTKQTWSSAEKPIEDTFIIGIKPFCNKDLKTKILKYNLLEYKCVECDNIGEWNNKLLKLQLDHINGNNLDNRIENLRFLCPNCHSQTETYAGKNNKKK